MKKMNRIYGGIGLLMILVVSTAACSARTETVTLDAATPEPVSGGAANNQVSNETGEVAAPETDENAPTEQPTDSDMPEESVDSTPDPRIPEPVLGFEYGDPNLKATAPSSFVRAAGKPQLVELFAFW